MCVCVCVFSSTDVVFTSLVDVDLDSKQLAAEI